MWKHGLTRDSITCWSPHNRHSAVMKLGTLFLFTSACFAPFLSWASIKFIQLTIWQSPPTPNPFLLFFSSFFWGGGWRGEKYLDFFFLCCSETYERPPLVEAGKSSFSRGLNVWSHVQLVQEKQLTVQVFSHLKRLRAGDGSLCFVTAIGSWVDVKASGF